MRGKIVGSVVTVEVSGKPPEDHPIYAQIGRVASNWSHVEHILDLIIWDLADTKAKVAACVTGQINGPGMRCSAILALLEAKGLSSKSLVKQIEGLRGACYKTADYRNRIVHDAWYVTSSGPDARPFRSMPKDELKFGVTELPNDYFQRALDKIQRRHDEASALHSAIRRALASRGKGR